MIDLKKKLAPLFRLIRNKTKTNSHFFTRVFSRFAPATWLFLVSGCFIAFSVSAVIIVLVLQDSCPYIIFHYGELVMFRKYATVIVLKQSETTSDNKIRLFLNEPS